MCPVSFTTQARLLAALVELVPPQKKALDVPGSYTGRTRVAILCCCWRHSGCATASLERRPRTT